MIRLIKVHHVAIFIQDRQLWLPFGRQSNIRESLSHGIVIRRFSMARPQVVMNRHCQPDDLISQSLESIVN